MFIKKSMLKCATQTIKIRLTWTQFWLSPNLTLLTLMVSLSGFRSYIIYSTGTSMCLEKLQYSTSYSMFFYLKKTCHNILFSWFDPFNEFSDATADKHNSELIECLM